MSKRVIENYDNPRRSDTLNFDANESSKNSRDFINRQNAILEGADPRAINGREARILNRQDGGEMQEHLPDLRYRESEVWVNDKNVEGMQHRLGNFRRAGEVESFEPTTVGRGLGMKTK